MLNFKHHLPHGGYSRTLAVAALAGIAFIGVASNGNPGKASANIAQVDCTEDNAPNLNGTAYCPPAKVKFVQPPRLVRQ